MKIEKPITHNMKKRCNALYLFLKQNTSYVSKNELMRVLGLNNERSVRDVVSTLAKVKPIISTSDNKGYKLATSLEDLEDVKHTWAELSKRIDELTERIQPLVKFYDKCKEIMND